MTDIGQIESNTQARVVKLFTERLGYDYLGDWQDRDNNGNVEEEYLRSFLEKQGYKQKIIDKAVRELTTAAGVQVHDLYDSNKDVYRMLRYGVSIRAAVGDHSETVHFIDWVAISELIVPPISAMLCQSFRWSLCQFGQMIVRLDRKSVV